MKKKILIISGGISKERLISLETGRQVGKELKKNGYELVKIQPSTKGFLYENDKKFSFSVSADFLVSKNNTIYVAVAKSGKKAFIEEIDTRRQLLEYSKVFNSNKLILIDTNQNKIKKILF